MNKLKVILANPRMIVLTIIILLVVGSLYVPMLKNWFYSDDTFWIWTSATTKFYEIFFVPERYRAMASNFTPMLGVSFKIDWNFFGLNPIGYSIHSLLSLGATSIALLFLLRLYMSSDRAILGIILFLLNPITLSVTYWYSTRHYIEGLFWCLLSLYSFVKSEKIGKISTFSGIYYLLASLNKEVYVVLPAVSYLISKGDVLMRIKKTLPLWAGLFIYTIWRIWIMGGIGGYPGNQPLDIYFIPEFFNRTILFLSHNWFGSAYILMYLILGLLFLFSLKQSRFLGIFLLLLIPIFPVSSIFDSHHYMGRYFFHLSVFIICMIIFLYDRIMTKYKYQHKVFAVIIVFLIIILNIRQDIDIIKTIRTERIESEASAISFLQSQKKYIESKQSSWFYESLRNIHKEFFGQVIDTRLVPDESLLKYADNKKLKEIKDSSILIPIDKIVSDQKRLLKGPIDIKMALEQYKLSWEFGPYEEGQYSILIGKIQGLYHEKYGMKPFGSFMLSKTHRDSTPDIIYIRILYQSLGDSYEIISDELTLSIPGFQKIHYISTSTSDRYTSNIFSYNDNLRPF